MTALADAYEASGFEAQLLDCDARKGHLLVTFPLGGTPDESSTRYGTRPDSIAAVRRWAQEWSVRIGQDVMEGEPWPGADEIQDGIDAGD